MFVGIRGWGKGGPGMGMCFSSRGDPDIESARTMRLENVCR